MNMWVLTCFALATWQDVFVNAAFSWGDPVIETVGSPSYIYSFNGHGEYVFLKSENGLEIQARLDYLVHGNTESTIFTAFTFTNHHVNETVQIEFDRASKHISLFLNNGTLWKTSQNCTTGPPIRTIGFMLMCSRPPSHAFHLTPLLALNNIALDVISDGYFTNIKVTSRPALTNTTGLAGDVHEGFYVSHNGTKFSVNATENAMFDYGESFTSTHFGNHAFLKTFSTIVTALFEECNVTNVTAITDVCTNAWDSLLDKECMLIMARTCNMSLAAAVHQEVERQHEDRMRRSNKPPSFLATMMNSTTIYNGNTSFVLNFTNMILDENMEELRFKVEPFISDEMKIDLKECHIDTRLCTKPREVCLNLLGNYSCVCDTGYSRSTLDADCKPTAATVFFGKLSYSIDTSIHINISRVEKDILLPSPGIDSGQLSNGNPLIELLRQLGCAVGQSQSTRSDAIDGIGADTLPEA